MAKPKLGPTGHPAFNRPHRQGDRGGLRAALTRVPDARQVQLEFGTTVTWVSAPPQGALLQAAAMRALVDRYWGVLAYDAADLPIRVVANTSTGMVESHFPERLSVLRANPEAMLAWADRLEEVVAQLVAEEE